ncbi:MAG: hypothetical protein ACI4NM_03525 [Bullifex sp.]
MMKHVILIALMMLLCVPVFAEVTYFLEQKSDCFNVDLGSKKYIHHTDNAAWGQGGSGNTPTDYNRYHDDQIICVVGVEGSTAETTLEFTFTGQDWYYILNGTDTRYKRPFGVDLVVRGNVGGTHTTISSVQHLGRQSSSQGGISASVTLPKTDGTATYNGTAITAAWLDVVLVMDPFVNTGTGLITQNGSDITDNENSNYGYVIGTQDIYTSSFTVHVNDTEQNYLFNLNGYYQRSDPDVNNNGFSSIISVFPNANATSFDVKTLKPDNDTISDEIVIGGYNFTTNSKVVTNRPSEDSAKAYFFVSSSPDGTIAGNKFTLKYVSPISGVTVANLNPYNSVTYEVGLSGKAGTERWFDGTDKYGSLNLQNSALKAVTTVEKAANQNKYTIRVFDEGSILLRISGDVERLSAGRYRSDIYFHVVTDW